jgi:hypothetical protein
VWGTAVWDGLKWDSLQGGLTRYPHQPPLGDPNEAGEFAYKIVRFQNKIYFGGSFYWVNGKNQYNMGVWDCISKKWDYPIAQPPNGPIVDFKVRNNTLYACGQFTKFGNTTCKYVAKFDGSSWQAVGDFTQFENNSQGPAQMNSIEVYNNEVFVGGAFDDQTDTPKNLAKYDGTNWVNVGTGIRQGGVNSVWCLQEHNGKLYIGGRFDKTTEIPGQCLVAWNGSAYEAVNSYGFQQGDYLEHLKSYRGKLYMMGGFFNYGSLPALSFLFLDSLQQCAIDPLSAIWTNPANINMSAFELIDDSLIIGGAYKYLDTVVVNNIGVITNFENNSSCLFTGIRENYFENNLVKIYPNPARNKLNIEFEDFEIKEVNLIVSNSLGQVLYSMNELSQKQEVDISFLQSGIYFLRLQKGSEQSTFKIIKE